MMCSLFHYGLRARDADTTLNFYTRVLGMRVDETRPNVRVTGYWLRAALPGSPPAIHVFTGEYARAHPSDAEVPGGSGAVHHMSLYCTEFRAMRQKLAEHGLPWEGGVAPGGRQWIIFVYDPNGVMLELTFDGTVEEGPPPEIAPENAHVPGQPFHAFDAARYAAFAS
jgi:catechol 2,3-dioxygenase-like lactoylglutathione lyase family enzyme